MRIIGTLLTFILIVVGAAFTALNGQAVAVNYLVGIKSLPLAVMLLLSFGFGALLTAFILGWGLLKLKTKNKWLTGKLKQQER